MSFWNQKSGHLRRAVALSLLLAAVLAGCAGQEEAGSPLRVEISHVVGAAPLQADRSYPTAAGDEFAVTKLRYYLSNVRLRRQDGSWFAARQNPASSEGYYLIDEAVAGSKAFEIAGVPAGTYDGIEFLVGIDAARNTAGAQTGTLDPARGLFWTWKSGYIFFLFEGRSPQSTAAGQALTYHIGGAAEPTLARTVFLPLAPKPARVEAALLPTVHLHADLARVFSGSHEIRIAALDSAMDSHSGLPIADNVAGIFSVDHLHHEPRSRAAPR